jgi:SAM-dependent methyltransferase
MFFPSQDGASNAGLPVFPRIFETLYNTFALRSLPRSTHRNARTALDIGCGIGEYSEKLLALGWRVTGIEIFPSVAEAAGAIEGLSVHCGTVHDLPASDSSFDLVVMSHVLEHVPRPRLDLERILRLLKPGGRLHLMVPNADAVERKLLGEFWHPYDVPLHLFHFTPATLSALLGSVGFVDVRVHPTVRAVPTLKSIDSALANSALTLGSFGAIVTPLVYLVQLLSAPALRTSQMWATARKVCEST